MYVRVTNQILYERIIVYTHGFKGTDSRFLKTFFPPFFFYVKRQNHTRLMLTAKPLTL